MPIRRPFTLDLVLWHPWVPTVDQIEATPEQIALVEEVSPRPTGRPYYALLAHAPQALRERTALMKSAMYSQDGATRADRKLAAVATSRANGCVHCASVHARLYAQLTKDEKIIQRILAEGLDVPLGERERAIVDYAAKLTLDPAGTTAQDLAPLRQAGFSDLAILDLTHVIGMFTWANQLFLTLGEVEPEAETVAESPIR
ncbi:MAG: peroxidase-related enzyme [Caldilineaceae bacterium]|nr:peroxidase-related enzyme [Caldilineaceae bacterium]